jgi:hypothetical protein
MRYWSRTVGTPSTSRSVSWAPRPFSTTNSGFCQRSQNWFSTRRRPRGSICHPHSLASSRGLGTPEMTLPPIFAFSSGSVDWLTLM